MQPTSSALWRILAAAILSTLSTAALAATVSGTVTTPTSDGGDRERLYGAVVRVEGTALKAPVQEEPGDRYTGTFSIANVPDGAVTLIFEEPPYQTVVIGDRFTQDSKRIEANVSGDVSGLSFDLVYHWRNLPSYPPPYQNPSYDIWEPHFVSADVGFMGFQNRGVSPFEFEVWRTTDGGQSWSKIGHWIGGQSNVYADLSGPSMLFVDADHGVMRGVGAAGNYRQYGVIRTADGGQTWTYVDLPNAPPLGDYPGGNGLVSIVNFGAIDATHWIICGGENVGGYMGSGTPGWVTLWETADSGATWSIAKTWPEAYGACSALGVDPSGRALLFDTPYAFGGNKILALRDVTGVWTFKEGNDLVTNTGYGNADAPMVDGTVWISGTTSTDSGTYLSSDGGLTWTRISTAQLQSFDFATELRGFATAGGPAYSSYDGGKTWRYQSGGGGICCHGNYMFAFSSTEAYWKDGGVGDPNGKGDVFRYFEQASPNFEVLKGTGVVDSTAKNGAKNVPVAALRFTSFGTTPLLLQPLHVRASGTGNDHSEIDLVTLWWDRDENGAVSEGDTAISTTTFGADDGVAELGLGSVPQLYQLYPRQLLVTYDVSRKVRDAVTFSASVEPAVVEAFTDDIAATPVVATAPNGTVVPGATITALPVVPIPPASIPTQVATENASFGYSVPAFTDPNGDALAYTFDGLPAWLAVTYPATNPRYISGRPPYSESSSAANKSYTITVTAKDPDNNSASTTFTLTVLNVNRAPTAPASIPNQLAREAYSFGYPVPAFTDPDGDTLIYSFSGLPGWLTVSYPETNPRYISGRPPLTESTPESNATYTVTLTATDTSGTQASRSFNVVVKDNRPPVASALSDQVATENAAFSYNMPAFTDPDGEAITYTVYGLPAWLKVSYPETNPRYISGRPPYTESTRTLQKSYTVTVNARDAVGQTTQRTFAVTVVNVNRPPVAPTTIPGQTAYENSSYSFNAPAFSDPDGDALIYSFSGLPSWLKVSYPEVNPRYISGRPPYTEATPGNPAQYVITLIATDPDGATASKPFNLTVNDVPD